MIERYLSFKNTFITKVPLIQPLKRQGGRLLKPNSNKGMSRL